MIIWGEVYYIMNQYRDYDNYLKEHPTTDGYFGKYGGNYLGNVTASFRALYERLIFQNLTYNAEHYCCNEHPVPVLFVMTSNGHAEYYKDLMQEYQQTFQRFVGPTETYACGDTLQLKDYSKTDWEWSIFDPAAKQKRHDTVFPEECRLLFEKGAAMGK